MIAAGFADGTIRTWKWRDGTEPKQAQDRSRAVDLRWSPDGAYIAAVLYVGDIAILDAVTLQRIRVVRASSDRPPLAWSWDRVLSCGTPDGSVINWSAPDWREPRIIEQSFSRGVSVDAISWSVDNKLATSLSGGSIEIWRAKALPVRLKTSSNVLKLVWLNSHVLVGACDDRTVRLWDVDSSTEVVMEGHTRSVFDVTVSGNLVASASSDGTIRHWRSDTYELIGGNVPISAQARILYNPVEPVLAVLERGRLGLLDESALAATVDGRSTIHYTNAKIVLVGDTGVGKTGLSRPLVGLPYESSKDSSHGRHIWTLIASDEAGSDGMIREAMLWDLAGQAGYRIFHRQHLDEVAVALVLFDSRSETMPFAGVSYWARALDQAAGDFPLVKFLVAARADRFGPTVSRERIQHIVAQYGFAGYFESSAAQGFGISELRDAVREAIQWDRLPRVSSPELFYELKRFLIEEKENGVIAASRDELLERFGQSFDTETVPPGVLDTCVGRLETVGLIKRLRFCDYILLQPELLDQYCAWIAQAARAEPDGLGVISEERVLARDFRMDYDRTLVDRESDERLLIVATLEEVIGRGIAFRETTEKGVMIVFPSELRADFADYSGEYVNSVAFTFEGPVSAIYATLTVRLLNSLSFTSQALYRNAAVFVAVRDNQRCGYALDYPDPHNDARGRLTVFFSADTDRDTKLLFLRYLNRQVERLALTGTLSRERLYECVQCKNIVPPAAVAYRIARARPDLSCPCCDARMPIDDLLELTAITDTRVGEIDSTVTAEQDLQRRMAVLNEREHRGAFQVLLSYSSLDREYAVSLAEKLRGAGILPWIDVEQIDAGASFARELERIIGNVPSAAVLIGGEPLGNWQSREYYALLERVDHRKAGGLLPLIPVLLPTAARDATGASLMPAFLAEHSYVDFRRGFDHRGEMERFIRAILKAEKDAPSEASNSPRHIPTSQRSIDPSS